MDIFGSIKKREASNGSTSIFKDNNPMGYFKKEEFKNNLELFSSDVKTQFKLRSCMDGFNAMKLGLTLSRTPNHTFSNGEKGSWLSTQFGKVKRNIFIPHFGDMERLIDDYAAGKIKIEKTLEEYYKEACEK